jgi:hypothetical protein
MLPHQAIGHRSYLCICYDIKQLVTDRTCAHAAIIKQLVTDRTFAYATISSNLLNRSYFHYTPYSRVIFEKILVAKLVKKKKFPTCHKMSILSVIQGIVSRSLFPITDNRCYLAKHLQAYRYILFLAKS